MSSCRVVETLADQAAAYAVRHHVFVEEQGVDPAIERDAADETCVHVVVERDGKVVATGRLEIQGNTGKIGRMAVLKEHRNQGLGTRMLRKLIEVAAECGIESVTLHAQVHALGFYEGEGFAPHGPEFEEAGIQHRSMRLMLSERRVKSS